MEFAVKLSPNNVLYIAVIKLRLIPLINIPVCMYSLRVNLILVHIVEFFSRGEGSDQEEPFRKWLSQIGQLRSLCTEVPLVALTATSGP